MIEYIEAKSILQKAKGGNQWFGIDYNINLYRGCNHGCIYCDSRSEVYQIKDFDKVKVKKDALIILERELKTKRNKGVVSLGAMSDAYNNLEKDLQLTRQTLQLLHKYGFGVSLETKSDLILRDLDILKVMNKDVDVIVKVSITDIDQKRVDVIEPNAASVAKRFEVVKTLNENGICCGILMMPLLPGFNDTVENVSEIVEQAKINQTSFIYPAFGVTLRKGQQEYFASKLEKYDQALAKQYKNYQNYSYHSQNKVELKKVFYGLCAAYNIETNMIKIIDMYKHKQPEQLFLKF